MLSCYRARGARQARCAGLSHLSDLSVGAEPCETMEDVRRERCGEGKCWVLSAERGGRDVGDSLSGLSC